MSTASTSSSFRDRVDRLRALPKIELHAHLNGSIREATLFELAGERSIELNDRYFETSPSNDEGAEKGDEGFFRDETVVTTMMRDDNNDNNNKRRRRSLMECFDVFSEIGRVVVDLDAIERITREALEDFAREGVAYLELRSTPKRLLPKRRRCCLGGDDGEFSLASVPTDELATKRQYCEVVIDALKEFRRKEEERYAREISTASSSPETSCSGGSSGRPLPRLPMIASFIVAVDRSNPVECGFEHVDLAIELAREHPGVVVGVDLGGNPLKNRFLDFRDCFEKARRSGLLSVTLHCAEVPCSDDDRDGEAYRDAKAILDFGPDRLGHALILPPSLRELLAERRIPVETCPTSNVMTTELVEKKKKKTSSSFSGGGGGDDDENNDLVDGVKRHPQLGRWLETDHPLCVCTDDPGVFDTNPTQEFFLVQAAFGLTDEDFRKTVLEAVDYTFTDDETKNLLRERLRKKPPVGGP